MNKNKITKEYLSSIVADVQFVRLGKKTTFCLLTLDNGFEIAGSSACVDENNFDRKTGEMVAFEDAFNKLWELEGYRLQIMAGGI